MIIKAHLYITTCLTFIFNMNWKVGNVPLPWRQDNKIFFGKQDKDRYDIPKAYRGISLESILGKLYERVVDTRLSGWMERNGFLDPYQYAYRKDKSITQALLHFSLDVVKSMKEKSACIGTFVDLHLRHAFDAIWRDGLIYKLKQAGIKGRMLIYIYSYLNGRQTRLIVNGSVSKWIANLIGVPQGSIIAPLLFIFFIAEMTNMLTKKISFADDLTMWVVSIDFTIAAEETKENFLNLLKWTNKWRLTISADKTEFICFSKQQVSVNIIINGTVLPQVKSKKVIGVILNENWDFSEHVEYICSKGFKALAALKPVMSCKNGAPAEIGVYLYTSCIRPILETCYPVWCSIQIKHYRKLEEVQRASLIAATGTRSKTALSSLEAMACVPPLRLRLEENLVCEIARILSKPDEDSLRIKILELGHNTDFMSNKMLTCIHLVKPILREMKTSMNELAENLEKFNPISSFTSTDTKFPERVNIDNGNWGSSGTRTKEQEALARSETAKFLETLPCTTVPIFTDGSALGNPGPCGAAAIIYPNGLSHEAVEIGEPVSSKSTSFHGELKGLDIGAISSLNMCVNLLESMSHISCIHFFCDCESAIKCMLNADALNSHNDIKVNFLKTVKSLHMIDINVKLSWVAGHVDLIPNEIADKVAKKAATQSKNDPLSKPIVTRTSIKLLSRKRTLARWQSAWTYSISGIKYRDFHPTVHRRSLRSHLPSFMERPLLRLRSFSTNLNGENTWKATLQEDFSPLCDCGQPETSTHILLDCPLLTDERNALETSLMSSYQKHNTPYHLRNMDMYTLLGGENDLSTDVQREIDRAVAEFLLKSEKTL